jgi:hypothetical protein
MVMQWTSQYCREKSYFRVCELEHIIYNLQVLIMYELYLHVRLAYAIEVYYNRSEINYVM